MNEMRQQYTEKVSFYPVSLKLEAKVFVFIQSEPELVCTLLLRFALPFSAFLATTVATTSLTPEYNAHSELKRREE